MTVGLLAPTIAAMVAASPASGQPEPVRSVPIRWCVIEGSEADTNPGGVSEPNTDNVLWRVHERTTDNTYIPDANITLRSGLWGIVPDDMLNFPVIPDQDTSEGDPGDIFLPDVPAEGGDDGAEWQATYNACVDEWSNTLGVGDIGVVAINYEDIIDTDGNTLNIFGVGWTDNTDPVGARRLLIEDPHKHLPMPPNTVNPPGTDDHVSKSFGHEVGHTLANLAHTNGATNLMRQGRNDTDGDGLLNNFRLSTSITDTNGNTVDQVDRIRDAAEETPGCTLTDGSPCTTLSDVKPDELNDAAAPIVDLTQLVVTEDPETQMTSLIHELRGAFSSETFDEFPVVESVVAADLDDDPTTGGMPSELGFPTNFEGAELVTRVQAFETIVLSAQFQTSHTVWRFDEEEETFVEQQSERISSQIVEMNAQYHRDGELHIANLFDGLQITMPNEIRGPAATPFTVQALVRGFRPGGEEESDRLDDTPEEAGETITLVQPEFPTCEVTPDPTAPAQLATVENSGLLPDRGVHVVFGDELVAEGMADEDGDAVVEFPVPDDAAPGRHLVTVGTDDTALTADCTVDVEDAGGLVERHSGQTRTETAVSISRRVRLGADTVVIARSDDYADALAGAPLATHLDAPVLLTGGDGLHPATAEEIERLGAGEAVLLGGQAALSSQVASDVEDLGLEVQRVGGADRFDTARLIADELPPADEVYIAEGIHSDPNRGWPDALSAAGVAAGQRAPVLLVSRDTLPQATADALTPSQDVAIVGGTAAVSEEVEADIDEEAGTVRRLAGATRYETSTEVADDAEAKGASPKVTWLATGHDWPDALVSAAATGRSNGVLLLIDGQDLDGSPGSRQWLVDHADAIRSLRLAGGTAAITEETRAQLEELLSP